MKSGKQNDIRYITSYNTGTMPIQPRYTTEEVIIRIISKKK